MTDHVGIMQFARISEPDPHSGYTLDDNARALIAACMYLTLERDEQVERLIRVYLDFIKARQIEDGSFLNYVDLKGAHSEMNKYVNLEDSNGRAIWALGYLASMQDILSFNSLNESSDILYKAIRTISRMTSPRAIAFSIKGLYFFHTVKRSDSIWKLVDKFADNLVGLYTQYSTPEWKWFERSLTYANAVLPEALLMAYLLTGKKQYRTVALESFDFLLSRTFRGERIKVVSNRSWLRQDSPAEHEYGEQPIDVAYTIIALDLFWKVFRNPDYRKKIDIAFEWFLGRNHLNQMVYNPASGGCYDGLEESYVNLNQGAESLVCYLISRLHLEFLRQEEEHQNFYEEEDPVPGADSRELRIGNG
jgi:hypothetical protein